MEGGVDGWVVVRWRALRANLDDYQKCITEARAQMAAGNFAKFDECTEISNR